MALTVAQKFINVGMPSQLAKEFADQLNSGQQDWKRLMWLGMVPALAKYLANSLQAGTYDPVTAVRYGMVESLAALVKAEYLNVPTLMTALAWNTGSYPLSIYKRNGVWSSSFSADAILPASYYTGTPLFCNFTTGNDANNGQAGQPVKSLWRLINLINLSANPVYAEVDAGAAYPRANWFNNTGTVVLTTPAWIRAVNGQGLAYNGDVLTWAADGSFPPNYKAARPNVARVVDLVGTSPYGSFYRDFAQFLTSAEVQAATYRWAQVDAGANLAVNRGGGVLNANTRAYLTSNGFRTNASLRLTGFDIEGGGGLGGCLHLQNVTGNVVIENCKLRYSGSDAAWRDCWFADNVNGLVAFTNCDFSSSSKDGGNAHWTTDGTRKTFVLTQNCTGADFGRGASTSNNAITAHETVSWIDINGVYSYGRGGTIRNVNDSRMAIIGGRVSYDLNDSSGNTPSIIRSDDTAQTYVVDTDVVSNGENTLLTSGSGIIYTKNVRQSGGVASGNVRPF